MSSNQKNITLIIGFLLSLILIYQLTLKKTFEAKKIYTELQVEKNNLDNASQKIQFLKNKNIYLDSILKQNDITAHSSFQQLLLKRITNLSENNAVEILEFNEPHRIEENKTIIETYSFKLQGNYVQLLKLIHSLEQSQMGQLLSVNFEKKKNYRTRKDFLNVKIYLQRIKS